MAAMHEFDALRVAAQYAAGRAVAGRRRAACLERIEAWEPRLNAMYRVDRDGALAAAKAAERAGVRNNHCRRWTACPSPSRKTSTRRATRRRSAPRPTKGRRRNPADAPPAARLREAGCVILGKTTMPDFGHAVLGPLQHSRRHAQSLEHCTQYFRLEFRRGRRRCGRLRAAAPRHRYRRLGAAAGDALRHLRAEAQPRPRAGVPALYRPRHRADDARRRLQRRADEPAVETRCQGLHEPSRSSRRTTRTWMA